MILTVIGAQWGDEGKGKIVDYLCKNTNHCVRYQGGPNAGHTVYVNGVRYKVHQVPSGIFHEGVNCYLGEGMVLDLEILLNELMVLENEFKACKNQRIFVSDSAHLILPTHTYIDQQNNKIGTTGKGIGPAYADKYARIGIQIKDLELHRMHLLSVLENHFAAHAHQLKDSGIEPEAVYKGLMEQYNTLKELGIVFCDVGFLLRELLKDEPNTNIIMEGGQGVELDINSDTYPYVTSSHVGIGGAICGSGVPIHLYPNKLMGVAKAYATVVGEGYFPSRMGPKTEALVRGLGKEYGTTTGRPRKVGWFDFEIFNKSARKHGIQSLALTKADVLDGMEVYARTEDGMYMFGPWVSKEFPSGFECFLGFLRDNLPVELVGIGPNRDEILEIGNPWTIG